MWLGKRFFDLCLSVVGLVILSPFFLIMALIIKLDSPGAVLFRQKRVGLRGKVFEIHKFRTMRDGPRPQSSLITVGKDPRITRVGHFLRKYKLDELPQLIDILLGSMSFVGPRPEVPKYVELYPAELRQAALSVRPGLTDKASIFFKAENQLLGAASDPEKTYIDEILPQKIKYHVEYAKNASFFGDLKIIFLTLKEVFISD